MRVQQKLGEMTSGLITSGDDNHGFMDRLCAFLLAISPLLQHYKGLFTDAGILAIILVFPYIAMKVLVKFTLKNWQLSLMLPVMPLALYHIYRSVNHGVSAKGVLQALVMICLYLAASSGVINVKFFVETALSVAVVTTALLLVQYLLFYVFKFHLHLNPTALLHEDSLRWITRDQTGTGGSFYRPSAIFLEPSHIFLYMFPLITILLLAPKMTVKRFRLATFLSLGIFLSTSGMGIAFTVGIWILHTLFYCGKDNMARISNVLTSRNLMIILLIPVLLVILYSTVDIFRLSVNRVIAPVTGRSAVQGRVSAATNLIRKLQGRELWFGASVSLKDIGHNMPGFHGTFYRHGLLGLFTGYLFYAMGLFKLKAQYFWISFVIIFASYYSANTHGAFYMLYYVVILMDGYNTRQENAYWMAKMKVQRRLKGVKNTQLNRFQKGSQI